MKKKKGGGGGANWMDTYGDMVTLLLCFFVLLYSMSTISEENWKALVMSFNPKAESINTETPGGNGPSADGDQSGVFPDPDMEETISEEDVEDAMEAIYQALKEYAAEQGIENDLSVIKGEGKVYVTFNQTAFFDGNSAVLRRDSYPILDKMCEVLSTAEEYIEVVQIQGHTAQEDPNTPNRIDFDRTLASDRATNVLIYLQTNSELHGSQLVSVGLGQWYPTADNESPEGRAANRRVELIISGLDLDKNLGTDGIQSFEIQSSNS